MKIICQQNNVGVYGLGVMGKNLALNMASKGYRVAVYNRTLEKVQETMEASSQQNIPTVQGYTSLPDFFNSLEYPRKVIIMVKAGDAVDQVLQTFSPYIKNDDILVDGGNEWYENTERRQLLVEKTYGAYWIGMGVSGGENGARFGASFMPGGHPWAYSKLQPLLTSAAAVNPQNNPCVTFVGNGGSGNYVKMVHNGIEYGLMQAIAEIYYILKHFKKYDNAKISSLFSLWNQDLQSFLLEITCDILVKKENNVFLLDHIFDSPKMNGTGTWTLRDSIRELVPVPSIGAAVDARIISSEKFERTYISFLANKPLHQSDVQVPSDEELYHALKFAMYASYVQGFQLIQRKNLEKQWHIDMSKLPAIWKGGCIIRSTMLDAFEHCFVENTNIRHVLFHKPLLQQVLSNLESTTNVMAWACQYHVPCPVISSSLQYILQYNQDRNSSNLIQAQRDFFGAHGYERIDRGGIYHTNWTEV